MSVDALKNLDKQLDKFKHFMQYTWPTHDNEFRQLQATVEQLQATVDDLVKKQKNLNHMQATVNYLKFEDMKQYFTVEPEHSTAVWNFKKAQIPCKVLKLNGDSTKALISFYNLKKKLSQRIVNYTELTFSSY